MEYTPTEWVDEVTPIDAVRLNNIEQGLVAAAEAINELGSGGGGNSGEATSQPITYIESLDESNLTNLRDLETGSYVMYGYFKPYSGAPNTLTFDNLLVNVVRKAAGTHVLAFSTLNSVVNFLEILVDDSTDSGFTYTRTDMKLLDLYALIEKVGSLTNLTTSEKSNLVAAINEVYGMAASGGVTDEMVANAVEAYLEENPIEGGGTPGEDGVSPTATVEDTIDGAVITITDKNGTTTATIKDGEDGEDGVSATHSWNGTRLTITSASGTSSADLKGEKGDPGEKGADGTMTFEDLTEEQKASLKGADGSPGADGEDGISPTVAISNITGGHRVSITDKNGTKSFDVLDGSDGRDGSNGAAGSNGTNGVSITSVEQTTTSTADGGTNVITVTLSNGTTSTFQVKNGSKGSTGASGSNGADGYTPVRGTDYWTATDIAEIKSYVDDAILGGAW